MELIALLLTSASLGFAGNCVNKLNSKVLGNSGSHYSLFILVNGVFACLYFFCFSGFKLQINGITALFSLIYGSLLIVSLTINVSILQYCPYALLSVLSTAYGTIVNTSICFVAFGEEVTAKKLIRAGIMLAAAFVIFAGRKKGIGVKKGFLRRMLFSFMLSTATLCTTKAYTIAPNVADKNSFFFFTNAVMVVGAVIWFLIDQYKCPISYKEHIAFLSPKRILFFASNTLCSNLNSVITLQMMAIADVTLYGPFQSALSLISSVMVSLVFKDKVNKFTYCAMGLAIVSVII